MRFDKADELWRCVSAYFVGSAVAGIVVIAMAGAAGAVSAPALTITPGPYHEGQLINVSVGPNRYFKPIRASIFSSARTRVERRRTCPSMSWHVTGTRFRATPFWFNPTGASRSTATNCSHFPTLRRWGSSRTRGPCATRRRAVCSTSGRTRSTSLLPRSSPPRSPYRSRANIHEQGVESRERSIRVERLRRALCVICGRGHSRAGRRCQRRPSTTERLTTRQSQRRPDHLLGGRAEQLLHSACTCEHSRMCRFRRVGGQSAQGHHHVRWEHHSGKHDSGGGRRKLFRVRVPGVRAAELGTWRAIELPADLQPDQSLRALRRPKSK